MFEIIFALNLISKICKTYVEKSIEIHFILYLLFRIDNWFEVIIGGCDEIFQLPEGKINVRLKYDFYCFLQCSLIHIAICIILISVAKSNTMKFQCDLPSIYCFVFRLQTNSQLFCKSMNLFFILPEANSVCLELINFWIDWIKFSTKNVIYWIFDQNFPLLW